MGVLTDHTALEVTSPGDASALRDVLSAIGSVDGSVDAQERAVIEAFFRTVPQLRDDATKVPPRMSRGQILADLAKLENERLQRQCFVLAVELAMASDGVNDAEDQYLEALKQALRIDDAFAGMVVQVLACKYARATEG
jgi:uncharacterized membrane protein YebE (DUF533 family)